MNGDLGRKRRNVCTGRYCDRNGVFCDHTTSTADRKLLDGGVIGGQPNDPGAEQLGVDPVCHYLVTGCGRMQSVCDILLGIAKQIHLLRMICIQYRDPVLSAHLGNGIHIIGQSLPDTVLLGIIRSVDRRHKYDQVDGVVRAGRRGPHIV